MRFFLPSAYYTFAFTTRRFDTGAEVNADSTPGLLVLRRGTVDSNMTITVGTVSRLGLYIGTATTPSTTTWTSGDQITVVAIGTVNSVVDKDVVDRFAFMADTPSTGTPSGLSGTQATQITQLLTIAQSDSDT